MNQSKEAGVSSPRMGGDGVVGASLCLPRCHDRFVFVSVVMAPGRRSMELSRVPGEPSVPSTSGTHSHAHGITAPADQCRCPQYLINLNHGAQLVLDISSPRVTIDCCVPCLRGACAAVFIFARPTTATGLVAVGRLPLYPEPICLEEDIPRWRSPGPANLLLLIHAVMRLHVPLQQADTFRNHISTPTKATANLPRPIY